MAGKVSVAIIVPVRQMNRAIRFYTKTLGGRLADRAPGKMKNFWAGVRLHKTDVWLVAPSKREKRSLAYTTLVVKDIKRSVKSLGKKGVKFEKAERMGPDSKVDGPIASDPFGASAFFKDTEGNLWMIWQGAAGM